MKDTATGAVMSAKRFRVKTHYHVWSVIDSTKEGKTTEALQHFGARGRGDKAAREAAYDYRDGLNDGYEDNEVSVISEDYDMGYRTGQRIRDDEAGGNSGVREPADSPPPTFSGSVTGRYSCAN